jgi:hypothetical protein
MSAGLKILYPIPPNICFPMAMATTAPRITPWRGKRGGKTITRSIAVTRALPSLSENGLFLHRTNRYSVAREVAIETAYMAST